MPKGDKYNSLTNYFLSIKEPYITLSFNKIEEIIGDNLPASAYKHRPFWSNTLSHSVAYGWLNAEYKTVKVNFERQEVTFEKDHH